MGIINKLKQKQQECNSPFSPLSPHPLPSESKPKQTASHQLLLKKTRNTQLRKVTAGSLPSPKPAKHQLLLPKPLPTLLREMDASTRNLPKEPASHQLFLKKTRTTQ